MIRAYTWKVKEISIEKLKMPIWISTHLIDLFLNSLVVLPHINPSELTPKIANIHKVTIVYVISISLNMILTNKGSTKFLNLTINIIKISNKQS